MVEKKVIRSVILAPNYERNVHFLKMIIEVLIVCAAQELELRGHRDHEKHTSDEDGDNMKKVDLENLSTVINTFAKFDTIIKDQCIYIYNAKMLSQNIQNNIISCFAEIVEDGLKSIFQNQRTM